MNEDGLKTVTAYLTEKFECQPDQLDAGFLNSMHSAAISNFPEEWDEDERDLVFTEEELEWAFEKAEEEGQK